MNKDNNFNQNENKGASANPKNNLPSDRTRSFTNTSKMALDQSNIKVDTDVNIKKAKVKRVVKKGVGGTFFCLKKTFQWTFNILLTLLLVGAICGVIVGGTFYSYVQEYLVVDDFDIDPSDLRNDLSQTSWIYYDEKYNDENGNPIYEPIELYGTENRSWVYYDQIPADLVNAFIAIEDERFWDHNGVDWKRTFGAAASFVTGSDDYGGSTITQQLIKNVTGDDDTTIQRKVTEIFKALSLTENRSKEEVLEMYLNRIHLSRSNYGVWAAAKYYFGKDLLENDEANKLTICECAALASIPKSPTKYDPLRNPDENKKRRKLVLDKMLELEWITQEEHTQAVNEELKLNITYEQIQTTATYSYFTDALFEQLVEDLGKEYGYTRAQAVDLIYTGGLTIYSTENPKIQRIMEEVFNDEDTFKKVDDGIQPQSAMVIMDPYTGEVVGIMGGRGEKEGKLDLNRATMSTRQVGSSIKPLTVYSPAMDLGLINYGAMIDDAPVFMPKMNRLWPKNSPDRYDGRISINTAVMKSKNTAAVKIVKDLMGVDYAYDFAKNTLHLESLVNSDKDVAPLALGGLTYGLTVMEMTAAYAIFPNDGYYSPPRLYTKVLNPDGTILLDRRTNEEEYVISEGTAKVMTKILQNVVSGGTASRITLKRDVECAGKTGTTNDNKDLYFCGFTPYYVGACWFGYDIAKDLSRFGTNPAMLAWEKVMKAVHEEYFEMAKSSENPVPVKTFDLSKLTTASYCIDSGLAPTDACHNDVRGSRVATGYYYNDKGKPSRQCNAHSLVDICGETGMLAGLYCPVVSTVSAVIEEESETPTTTRTDTEMYVKNEFCNVHTTLIIPELSLGENEMPVENFEVTDSDFDTTLDAQPSQIESVQTAVEQSVNQ